MTEFHLRALIREVADTARALRIVAKAVLRDLWLEAKRIHELPGGHRLIVAHSAHATGVPT